jgi:hypothetical protein
MTLLFYGSTEAQDVPVWLACFMKMDLSSSSQTPLHSESTSTLGIRKLTYSICNLQEEYLFLYVGWIQYWTSSR